MKPFNKNIDLVHFAKWGVSSIIALLLSNYLISRLGIANNFLEILFAAAFVSVLIQAVRSHENEFSFSMRWFFFHFLVYAFIVGIMNNYFITLFFSQTSIFSIIIIGLALGLAIILIEKIGIKSRTLPWISFILILILIVANLEHLAGITSINLFPIKQANIFGISENKQTCPSFSNSTTNSLSPSFLNGLIDTNIWRIEHGFDLCYLGKYAGQYPDRFYCDNLIVSRWDTSSSGTINYRWYTATTTEWIVNNIGSKTIYALESFLCENGKKVTVKKDSKQFYVHNSRDGTPIRIEY